MAAHANPVGYSITITTAYASGDPFPNRIDHAWTADDTGYIQITNTGETTFSGVIGTVAVSPNPLVNDMSFRSDPLALAPGAAISIAIPYDSSSVGGFNGPAYEVRPGVEIYLNGTMSDGTDTEAVNLLVTDSDIHSGVWSLDPFNRWTDSFVLQGGDPWGYDTDNTYALTLAYGVYSFSQAVPEPGSLSTLATALVVLGSARWLQRRRLRPRRA